MSTDDELSQEGKGRGASAACLIAMDDAFRRINIDLERAPWVGVKAALQEIFLQGWHAHEKNVETVFDNQSDSGSACLLNFVAFYFKGENGEVGVALPKGHNAPMMIRDGQSMTFTVKGNQLLAKCGKFEYILF